MVTRVVSDHPCLVAICFCVALGAATGLSAAGQTEDAIPSAQVTANDPQPAEQQPADAEKNSPAQPADAEPAAADEEAKSRIVRALLKMLDEAGEDDEITDEDRKTIRQMLLEADEELYRSTNHQALQSIQRANMRRHAVRVYASGYSYGGMQVQEFHRRTCAVKPATGTGGAATESHQPDAGGDSSSGSSAPAPR